MRCCSRVMIWGQRKALQAGRRNFAVFVFNVARLGWRLKKVGRCRCPPAPPAPPPPAPPPLLCLSSTWLGSDGCSKKFVSTLGGKKLRHFLPGEGERPLLKSQQRANSQSSTRVKTVNRGKHGTERENTRNNQNSIRRKNTNVFFLLPDIAADKPATDL